jgi:peptide-methionine (R)-S-oxide reductase
MNDNKYPVEKSEQEWRESLSKKEFNILREQGTEAPFTGELNDQYSNGIYSCKGCNTPLYESKHKFESNCGWPSYDMAMEGALEYKPDRSSGTLRTEIVCANCGGHQGHVFEDGPTQTGLRFCVNSASINFTVNQVDKDSEK